MTEDAYWADCGDNPDFVDPEPLTVFLGTLGFLGSVASIASYVESRRRRAADRERDTQKMLYEARDLVMALEVDTMQMEVSLQKLEFLLLEADTLSHDSSLSNVPFKFGAAQPIFTSHGYRKFEEVLQDLNKLIGNSIHTTGRLIERIYNAGPEFSDDVRTRVLNLQIRLNDALVFSGTLQEAFHVYYELVSLTRDFLRSLRWEIQKATDNLR